MSKMSRNKGANGERELFSMLSAELGLPIKRNLTQTRLDGGADTLDVPVWDIEVKRVEQKAINSWWAQTVEQCQTGKKPMLFYRANYQPWQAMVYLQDINDDLRGDYTVTMPFLAACMLIREGM